MPKPRIGICLSGGGFRAAFYALGVLRYLAEAELLESVVAISAVSGGSIAAAAFADRADVLAAQGWTVDAFLAEIDLPFRTALTTHNLRNAWLFQSATARFQGRDVGRGAVLGELLAKLLYVTDRRVAGLPDGPQVVFTTTDLATGRAFRIARDFIGSYDFGYVQPAPETIELGFAVAASAAVPALFPPAWLPTQGLGLRTPPEILSLVDGGVYDNLGLEWFQGWTSGRPSSAVKPDFVIVANASGILHTDTRAYGGLRAVSRTKNVQYSQTTKLRVRWFTRDLLAGRERGVYIGIGLDPRGYKLPNGSPIDPHMYQDALSSDLVAPLARLRTDLDRFLPEEADLLAYHGYHSLHGRLAALYPSLAIERPAWSEFATLNLQEVARLRSDLVIGAKRLRRPRRGPRRKALRTPR